MSTNAPLQRMASTRAFRDNARFYAPVHLTRHLQQIAVTEPLAVIIDVDALDKSTFARGDRVMILALDALSSVRVQVVLVSRTGRAVALQRCIPRSWCVETACAVPALRKQMPGVRTIAVSDDLELLTTLSPDDRGVTLVASSKSSNVITMGEVSVRATLWWLVDQRGKAGLCP